MVKGHFETLYFFEHLSGGFEACTTFDGINYDAGVCPRNVNWREGQIRLGNTFEFCDQILKTWIRIAINVCQPLYCYGCYYYFALEKPVILPYHIVIDIRKHLCQGLMHCWRIIRLRLLAYFFRSVTLIPWMLSLTLTLFPELQRSTKANRAWHPINWVLLLAMFCRKFISIE